KVGNAPQEAYYSRLAARLTVTNNVLRSIELAHRALEIIEGDTANTDPDRLELYLILQDAYFATSNKASAIGGGELALMLAQRLDRDEDIVKARIILGQTYYTTGQYDKAIVSLEGAIELSNRLGSKSQTGRALALLGEVVGLNKGTHLGTPHIEQAVQLLREIDEPALLAAATRRLAVVYAQGGYYHKA